MILTLSPAEFEQINVDLENAIEELTTLSKEIDWFCSEMPDRLKTCLEIIGRAK